MSAQGFHGDTFSDGFGGFQTMKKRQQDPVEVFDYPQQFLQGMQIDEVTTNHIFKKTEIIFFAMSSSYFPTLSNKFLST